LLSVDDWKEKSKNVRITIEEIKWFVNQPQKDYFLLVPNMCLTQNKLSQIICQLSNFSGDRLNLIETC